MRVQEVVLGVQAGAIATKGVLGDACAAGYRERSGMAYGGARVPEAEVLESHGPRFHVFTFLD